MMLLIPLSMTSDMMTRTEHRKKKYDDVPLFFYCILFFFALSLATTTMATKGRKMKKKGQNHRHNEMRTELNWKRERYECVSVRTMRLHESNRVESSQLNRAKLQRATKAKANRENGVLSFFLFSHSLSLSSLHSTLFVFSFLYIPPLPTLFHFLIHFSHFIFFPFVSAKSFHSFKYPSQSTNPPQQTSPQTDQQTSRPTDSRPTNRQTDKHNLTGPDLDVLIDQKIKKHQRGQQQSRAEQSRTE